MLGPGRLQPRQRERGLLLRRAERRTVGHARRLVAGGQGAVGGEEERVVLLSVGRAGARPMPSNGPAPRVRPHRTLVLVNADRAHTTGQSYPTSRSHHQGCAYPRGRGVIWGTQSPRPNHPPTRNQKNCPLGASTHHQQVFTIPSTDWASYNSCRILNWPLQDSEKNNLAEPSPPVVNPA